MIVLHAPKEQEVRSLDELVLKLQDPGKWKWSLNITEIDKIVNFYKQNLHVRWIIRQSVSLWLQISFYEISDVHLKTSNKNVVFSFKTC